MANCRECGNGLEPGREIKEHYKGIDYFFCCKGCLDVFRTEDQTKNAYQGYVKKKKIVKRK